MKIIYMGTPDFAVGPLKALIGAGHEVVCVLTRADKPKGRGHAVQFSPVKEAALEAGIPVLQPVRMKDPELWKTLEGFGADMFVVAAYGRILPKEILSIPKYGCVNIHASLLPDYRGAAPIQWAVIDGRKETGITTMLMDEGLDTGDILRQYRITGSDPGHRQRTGGREHRPRAPGRDDDALRGHTDKGERSRGLDEGRGGAGTADPGTGSLAGRLQFPGRQNAEALEGGGPSRQRKRSGAGPHPFREAWS